MHKTISQYCRALRYDTLADFFRRDWNGAIIKPMHGEMSYLAGRVGDTHLPSRVCALVGQMRSLSCWAGPRDIKLVSPRGGVNIDPSPVSRSYCRSFRSAPWCRSYRDLAEAQSYNPPPFAPQETLVILHPGITASEALTAISYSGMRRSLRKVGSASGVHNKVR